MLNFFDDMKMKHYSFSGRKGSVKLTEFECLLWAIKCKTAKETARILSISPPTVEDYLNQLKSKLGFLSKQELLAAAKENKMLQYWVDE